MRPLCFLPLLTATPALADTLAAGDAATLLNIDDGFIGGLMLPTALAFLPDGRIVVTQKAGAVRLFEANGMPAAVSTIGTFTVDTESEKGLLNVLVHPEFATNRLLIFYYSAADGGTPPPMGTGGGSDNNRHRVVTIRLGENNMLEMATQKVLLQNLRGPANHDGGALSIYGDKLFVGVGDTGANSGVAPSAMRVTNYASTCLTDPNGKVLRINLDGTIPTDNPLVGKASSACGALPGGPPGAATMTGVRTEIFAWGFRNPWRVWADPKSGNLWVGDVGEVTYEEINVVPKAGGKHFGWPFREGDQGMAATQCAGIAPGSNCVDPAYFCQHSDNTMQPANPAVARECNSLTGGIILDACEWPASIQGRYVFGDYESRQSWSLAVNAARDGVSGQRAGLFAGEGAGPVHYAENAGALSVVMHAGNGRVTRISPKMPEASCTGGGGMGGSGGTGGGGPSGGAAGMAGGGKAGGSSGGMSAGGTGGSSPVAGGTGGASTGGASPSNGGTSAGGSSPASGGSSPAAGGSGNTPSAGGRSPSGGSGNPTSGGSTGNPSAGAAGDAGGGDDGGCGCRVAGSQSGGLAAVVAALGLSFLFGRRRRSRRS
ncbi:MAG TPA: PQQ-dependent sugar dehydrogenase [Polyangiaceae bacterium]|nr:PQQ-dependent sugar dehydrogenase [Polyangiaceae bacterium]